MNLFNELKRRNVFRVGIAYGITAWLLAQVADLMLESFGAPDWVMKTVLVVLLIGFPLALIFAWAFELTPEGLKKETEVDRSQSIASQTGKKLDRAIIGVLVVAVALLVMDRFRLGGEGQQAVMEAPSAAATQQEADQPENEIEEKSIAVLPFVNMSSDPEQEYFSDGISEEILNALARVKELKVAGRTSSFAFKGRNQDLREIGEALGVNHILEGSVRKAGEQVRITAQLIQARDGFHLWSDTYDRKLDDIFAIQDEISQAIIGQLKAALLDTPVSAQAATNTRAYELYLLAKQNIRERTEPSLQTASSQLDQAISIDPGFAPALAQRAVAELLLSLDEYGTIPNEQSRSNAKRWIDRSLELGANLDEPWAALGLYWVQATDRSKRLNGIEPLQRALAINPNLTDASNWLQGVMADQGRLRESITLLEQMLERDPLYRPAINNLILRYNVTGQVDNARDVAEQARKRFGNDYKLLANEASILYFEGRTGEAIPMIREAWQQLPNDNGTRFQYALYLFNLWDLEGILELNGSEFRAAALDRLGRTEEATLLAYKLAASGEDIGSVFHLLGRSGRHAELVDFFEARWASLEDWASEFPSLSGFGNIQLALMAHAYRTTGNQERFVTALRMLEENLRLQHEQGANNMVLLASEAYLEMLKGNEELALDKLSQSVEGTIMYSPRITDDLPVFKPLEGDSRFEAIQQRNLEIINRERATLGWQPVALDRAP
jgi:TolB-like protein